MKDTLMVIGIDDDDVVCVCVWLTRRDGRATSACSDATVDVIYQQAVIGHPRRPAAHEDIVRI
jgi:hypothetical protein